MNAERKVVVITGASQGIGAGLVRGFLDRDYRVVANSRSIKPDASSDVLSVARDIADPQSLHEARRQKLAAARHRRREKNLELRQPTLPIEG